MNYCFSEIKLPERSNKPRSCGITMVLDKGLGLRELNDLLETAGHLIDIVKLGWGTSLTQECHLVKEKCELLSRYQILVCPGGTLTELAYFQNKLDWYLNEAHELGFSCIEVSDGTVPISQDEKLKIINKSIKAGFRVTSEVGSKISEEDRKITMEDRINQIKCELNAGVWKVIIEARESGTQGIFDQSGVTQLDLLNKITSQIKANDLIFEAPQRNQQSDLILSVGSNVNLGNIAPCDVIPLETLRLGLRSETLRYYHLGYPSITIGLGVTGALAAANRGDIIIMVDALRVTSTIVTALAHGFRSVRPVNNLNECVGEITAGERGGYKIDQLNFDNSPLSFANSNFIDKELVLTSSNGIDCLYAFSVNPKSIVLIGSLLNVTNVAESALEFAKQYGTNISIVCAGRNNRITEEDLIVASEIAFTIKGSPILGDIKPISCNDFYHAFISGESGQNLCRLGKTGDVIFCATKDKYNITPIFQNGYITKK